MQRAEWVKLLCNAAWLFSEKVVRLFGGLLIGIWLARYLGPKEYGTLNYGLSWVGIFGAFAWFGIGDAVVKDIVKKPEKVDFVLSTAFCLRIFGSVLAAFASLIVFWLFHVSPDSRLVLVIAFSVVAMILVEPASTLVIWFLAKSETKPIAMARNVGYLANQLLRASFILLQLPMLWFAVSGLIEAVLTSLVLLLAFRTSKLILSFRKFSATAARKMLSTGVPIMLAAFLSSLYAKIDQVMLGQLSELRSVGEYAAASRISEIWWSMPAILMQAIASKYLFSPDAEANLEFRVSKLTCYLFWFSLFVAASISLFAQNIVVVLLGSEYHRSVEVLLIHIWTAVFVFIDAPAYQYMLAKNLQKLLIWKSLSGLVINFSLCYWLIPEHGAVGASVATVIAYAFATTFGYVIWPQGRVLLRSQVRGIFYPLTFLLRKYNG